MTKRAFYVPASLNVLEVDVRDEIQEPGMPKPEGDLVDSHTGVWWHKPNRFLPDKDVWQVGTITLDTFLVPTDKLGNVGTVTEDIRSSLTYMHDESGSRHYLSGYGWATIFEHVIDDDEPATVAAWDVAPSVGDVWRSPLPAGWLTPLEVQPFDGERFTVKVGQTIELGSMDTVGPWIWLAYQVSIGAKLYRVRRTTPTVCAEKVR